MILMMFTRLSRSLKTLELAEQILNIAAFIALISVFFPWFSGEWLRKETAAASDVSFFSSFSGLGFFTSFIGLTILLLHAFILLVTLIPIGGGPVIVKKRYKEVVRLYAASQAVILVLAALSVLTKVTFEFPRMELRFGIYLCLVASLIVLFEAFSRFLEQRKSLAQEVFHHPEDLIPPEQRQDLSPPPPPPPPPPAPEPEEHRLLP